MHLRVYSFYSEQKLNVIDIKLNEQQTLAWLKINMESPSFPDIHLDLTLKAYDSGQWKGVDFRFKGITYVTLKKNSYRQDFEDLKFQGLLRSLMIKIRCFLEICVGVKQIIWILKNRHVCRIMPKNNRLFKIESSLQAGR